MITQNSASESYRQNLVFPATALDIRNALDRLFTGFRPLCLPAEESGTIELVLAEVLNNVVEHAYRDFPTGTIELHVSRVTHGFFFEVIDAGSEMPGGKLPDGHLVSTDTDLNSIPEGGFGWFLIQDLARDVSYRRVNGKNHLSFLIAVDSPVSGSK